MTVVHPSLFAGPAWKLGEGAVFFGLLATICLSDIRTRRIPNKLVLALAVCGLVVSAIGPSPLAGLLAGVGGIAVGLAIWLPSWLFRLLGAGDVKMYAAASAWLGMRGSLEGAVLGAFAGGLMALVWMLRYRGMRGSALTLWAAGVHPKSLIQPIGDLSSAPALPYTVALAVGAGIAACFPHLLF